MRLHFLLTIATLTSGCTIYDSGLLEEAVGNDDSPLGDGDNVLVGDGDANGGTPGDGDITGGSPGDGDSPGVGGEMPGTGGTPVEEGASVLDDFSAPAAFINPVDGRFGPWAVWVDPTPGGSMSPGPGEPFATEARDDDTSNQALHITCTGFSSYGCGAYALLNNAPDPMPYDMESRGYDAIRFLAKLGDASAHVQLQIAVGDEASTATPWGACETPCNDPDKPTAIVPLTMEWQEHTVPFASFFRRNSPDPIDLTKTFEVQLAMDSENVDFWIDDIRFVDLDD